MIDLDRRILAKLDELIFLVKSRKEMSGSKVKCPYCMTGLIDLPSVERRVCGACHREYEWKLGPGQKSVLINGLVGMDDTTG